MDTPGPVRARFGAFELDEANARLLRDGKPIALAPTPFTVLCTLVRQPGTLLTKNQLLDSVWGHQHLSDSVLKTAISDLRTALGDDPRQPRYIETVARRGYRFIASTGALDAAPVPHADEATVAATSAIAPTRDYVGREAELATLDRAWKQACSGKRALVWIAGEPGIGKTALIERFVAGLGDVLCVRGQCIEHFGEAESYLPVLEALAQLCRTDASLAELVRKVAPTWLLQLPWLCTPAERDLLRRELAGVGPERMLREIGELLDRCADRRPLLLITEDLHWSDRSTIQLINYLAHRHSMSPMLWVSSFRLTEVVAQDHPLNQLRHELRLHGLCEEIVLDPFSEREVAACVEARWGVMAEDEDFVRALHERTDGVPLFVVSFMREVLTRASSETGNAADAARLVRAAVPEKLAGAIDGYIARLEPQRRVLLAAAAACGVEFRVATVASLLDQDGESVEQTCEELAQEQLWLKAPRDRAAGIGADPAYAFSHALFRQVIYEHTAPLSRAQFHARIGTVLERERAAGAPVTAAELGMHFERGRQPMAALRYYAEAADAALQKLSPAECMEITARALDLLAHAPAGAPRDALEITLATLRGIASFHLHGVGSQTRSALQRAFALDCTDHPLRGLLLHAFGWTLGLRAEYAEALAVASQAETLWSASSDPALLVAACTVRGQVHLLQGDPSQARRWLERGLPAAESFDVAGGRSFAADPKVTLLAMLSQQLLHLGFVAQARERLQQAYARAVEIAQPTARMVAMWDEALCELRLGNAERVGAVASEMQTLVEEFALAQGRAAAMWFRGWADARRGDALDAYRRIREALDANMRLGMLAGASETLGYAAEALLRAGEADEASQQLEEAFRLVETYGERVYLPQLMLLEAAIARARGETAAAGTAARRALEEARAQQAPWLELTVLLEICESGPASPADRQALRALVEMLPEAVGTAAFARARAVLDA